MRKRHHFYRFTLVELLVSMVIFVILLALMLQFFTGARAMWSGFNKKNQVYADARIAMDVIVSLLQGQVSDADTIPFLVDNPNTDDSRLCFWTRTPMHLKESGERLHVVVIRRDTQTSDHEDELQLLWWYNGDSTSLDSLLNQDFSNIVTQMNSAVNTTLFSSSYTSDNDLKSDVGAVLIKNVTGFRVRKIYPSTVTEVAPMAIEIRLSLMDPAAYEFWSDTSLSSTVRDQFRRENEYTFSRVVFFDDVERTVKNDFN